MNTIEMKHPNDLSRLRRLALSAQGLLQKQPFGRGLPGVRNAIGHMGYVQIDTISVVARAHHHVLYSRVPNYQPEMIQKLLSRGDIFEYWSHAAAFLPMADFRFSLPDKEAIKKGRVHWYKNPDKKLMKALLKRIQCEGPVRSRDLESNSKKTGGWWEWKPAKKALEHLYMQGDLMVSQRDGFQKTYDLTERVLPKDVDTTPPGIDEFAAHLIDQQLRCHGLVSLKGITYLRRNRELRRAVKMIVEDKLARGELTQVVVNSGENFLLKAGALEKTRPRVTDRLLILSPFDNCVIQRDRLNALFQFAYQVECYLPASRRRFGYFCLPLLYRDAFIGRMDCKAHRKDRHLEIKSLHFEPDATELDSFLPAFVAAVASFCQFQQCDSVSLKTVNPSTFREPLRRALARLK